MGVAALMLYMTIISGYLIVAFGVGDRLDRSQANFIRRAHCLSAFDSAAGHPHCETKIVMIASVAGLSFG